MSTYKMPEVLGGGEFEEHPRGTPTAAEAPSGTVAFLINGCLVCVAAGLLAEVKPQPEPGYYVADDIDGATVLAERDGEDWYLAGQIGSVPWGAVRDNYSTFTRLIPAPEPVGLPWVYVDREHCGARVNESPRSWGACRINSQNGDPVDLTAEAAEDMAQVLWSAAARHREATNA